jgi:hypothetical protein
MGSRSLLGASGGSGVSAFPLFGGPSDLGILIGLGTGFLTEVPFGEGFHSCSGEAPQIRE